MRASPCINLGPVGFHQWAHLYKAARSIVFYLQKQNQKFPPCFLLSKAPSDCLTLGGTVCLDDPICLRKREFMLHSKSMCYVLRDGPCPHGQSMASCKFWFSGKAFLMRMLLGYMWRSFGGFTLYSVSSGELCIIIVVDLVIWNRADDNNLPNHEMHIILDHHFPIICYFVFILYLVNFC
jgi:hypothetical protein